MSKIASLGLAEKATKVGLWRYCFSENNRCCDGLGMKGILQAPDDAVLIDKFWFNGQEIGAVWQDDDDN